MHEKILKFFHFYNPEFFELAEISGVDWVMAKKQLFKIGLSNMCQLSRIEQFSPTFQTTYPQ